MNLNNGLKKEYWGKSFKELLKSPVYALSGISEEDAKLLYKVFQIETIEDYAKLQSVKWARSILTLADVEE